MRIVGILPFSCPHLHRMGLIYNSCQIHMQSRQQQQQQRLFALQNYKDVYIIYKLKIVTVAGYPTSLAF